LAALLAATVAPASAKAYSNVEYSRPGGQSLRFDANVPDGDGPFPAAILVHGGAWVTGDKQYNMEPLFAPLERAGIAWFSINYRLLGGDSIDSLISLLSVASLRGAVDDVRQAVAYVKQNAGEYNIDPNRIVLIGESAGAHLTLMAALQPEAGGGVRASVAFYAPSDLVRLVQETNRIPEQLRRAVKGSPIEALLMAGLRELSPLNFVRADGPPTLLIHGTADNLVPHEQSTALCAAMQEAKEPCDVYTVEGAGHGIRRWRDPAYQQRLTEWLAAELR
jgi:acetyl esterase/lipase